MRRLLPTLLALAALGCAAGPVTPASAAEPPNQNDPCSVNARDSCGTTGIGQYKTYKFGPRWFGDYRGAIPGVTGPSFCIDLRFWYPSKAYGYVKRPVTGLKNRDGDAVPVGALRRMAYALWTDGRTQDKTSQGAVMLYVHRQMGDGAPGEIDPKAVSPQVAAAFTRITNRAAKYAGPYKLEVKAPDELVAGKAGTVTVRVLAASGSAVPNVDLAVGGSGADGLPKTANTGTSGTASIPVTGTDAAKGLKVNVTTDDLPSDLPVMYAPTKGESARSGQRLVVPDSQTLRAGATATVKAQPTVRTQVSAASLEPGGQVSDSVVVEGLQGRSATVKAMLYGPFPSPDKIVCTTPPVWSGELNVKGDGTYQTEPVTLPQSGFYTYRESLVENDEVAGVETQCAEAPETTIVRGKPTIRTQVSAAQTAPGQQIHDTAVVSGLGVLSAPVKVELWGPFEKLADIRCEGTPVATQTFTANGDGSYDTAPVTLPVAGYYTYREQIEESPATAGVLTECGEAAETTFARATPVVTTAVSDAIVRPGSSLFDHVKVTGAGKTPLKIQVDLYGPFHSRAAIRCVGEPRARTTLEVPGDGTFPSAKVKVDTAGFYTFRERIAESKLVAGVGTACGEETETSLVAPLILTGRGDGAGLGTMPRAVLPPNTVVPTKISIASLGVSADIATVDIDTRSGALAIPKNIRRVGWWRDGAQPGSAAGAILIGGHVDSAKQGGGAFYPLKSARRGTVIKLTSDDGKVRSYRVTGVQTVRKAALPQSIFSRTGPRRLVLVTCGGPFDAAIGHYRDNVIVTARPV